MMASINPAEIAREVLRKIQRKVQRTVQYPAILGALLALRLYSQVELNRTYIHLEISHL